MALFNLKTILNKKSPVYSLLEELCGMMNVHVQVSDTAGNIFFNNNPGTGASQFPVGIDGELIGYVTGDAKARLIAGLLTALLQKENDKKKLGKEVLNLYKEINFIFDFSEKLAQAIDPSAIARIALEEAGQLIHSDGGVVVLWNEDTKQLKPVTSSGQVFFNLEKVNEGISLLLKIVLSGQSEITSDIADLKQTGIIKAEVNSIIYGALKVNQRVMGAIILADYTLQQYSAADLKLLTTLALQSSSAIESAMLYEKNIREAREKEEAMRRLFEVTNRFVPVEFIKSLGHHTINDVKLGDQVEKIVTVLFSDIRDFTSLSEKMTPHENFRFVQSFSGMMGPIIGKHNGFINQYLGDAIMAIFPGSSMDALNAAIEIQRALQKFNLQREAENLPIVQIGLGLHTGPLIMGIIGDTDRLDAATISDTVNTASRLESLTKYYKAGIIISDAALQQIDKKDTFHLRYLGRVQLKGKQSAIGIHECYSGSPHHDIEHKTKTLTLFNEGMNHYINKSFREAGASFEKITIINPNDLTAKYFLTNVNRYLISGVPDNWIGVEEMLSK